jgi:hypothetical protein
MTFRKQQSENQISISHIVDDFLHPDDKLVVIFNPDNVFGPETAAPPAAGQRNVTVDY